MRSYWSKGCDEPTFSGEADGATEGYYKRLYADGLDPSWGFDSYEYSHEVIQRIGAGETAALLQ